MKCVFTVNWNELRWFFSPFQLFALRESRLSFLPIHQHRVLPVTAQLIFFYLLLCCVGLRYLYQLRSPYVWGCSSLNVLSNKGLRTKSELRDVLHKKNLFIKIALWVSLTQGSLSLRFYALLPALQRPFQTRVFIRKNSSKLHNLKGAWRDETEREAR